MPGKPLAIDLVLLLRRDIALEPDKAALGGQPLAQFGGVEVGQVGGQELHGFIDIDQMARFGVERGHAHVGRQDFAVAVENIRPRRRNRVAAHGAMRITAVGCGREHDQPQRNDRIDGREQQDRQSDARPRLRRPIDLVVVKEPEHQAPPARHRPVTCVLRDRGHRFTVRLCGGQRLVRRA